MQILGVDIGGTGIKGAIVDTKTGELISERVRFETPHPATPQAVAETLKRLVTTLKYSGPIGCGFPARVLDGIVKTAANIDESWVEIPVNQMLSESLNCEVFVANDADVAGLCEAEIGAAKDSRGVVVFLTLGTGIGSSIFINGTPFLNTELGHLKFKGEEAEKYCSALVREKEELKWKEWGERLNSYLKYVAFILNPDLFVIGGGASKKFDKFKDKLSVGVPVVPAQHLNLAGIIGAAMYGEHCLHQHL
ncbi:MAG: ROK family protein [Succinivibrio sp.]|nr:ROK family protein [Succinivibrio sp.]